MDDENVSQRTVVGEYQSDGGPGAEDAVQLALPGAEPRGHYIDKDGVPAHPDAGTGHYEGKDGAAVFQDTARGHYADKDNVGGATPHHDERQGSYIDTDRTPHRRRATLLNRQH